MHEQIVASNRVLLAIARFTLTFVAMATYGYRRDGFPSAWQQNRHGVVSTLNEPTVNAATLNASWLNA